MRFRPSLFGPDSRNCRKSRHVRPPSQVACGHDCGISGFSHFSAFLFNRLHNPLIFWFLFWFFSPLIFPFISLHPSHPSCFAPLSSRNMATTEIPRKLWEHPDPQSTQMYILMQEINKKKNLKLEVCCSWVNCHISTLLRPNSPCRHSGIYISIP